MWKAGSFIRVKTPLQILGTADDRFLVDPLMSASGQKQTFGLT